MDRRTFLALMGAAGLVPRAGQAEVWRGSNIHIVDYANGAFMDRAQVPSGFDGMDACTRVDSTFLKTLAQNGVDTVMRYYSQENNAGINCKNITARERDALHDHAMSVAMVYQFQGRDFGRYRPDRAQADAQFCLERARVIRQPEGSAIYFGVDSDGNRNSNDDVRGYFQEVRRIFQGRFQVGIYAAGARCRTIYDEGLADFFWVPEAPAWEGTTDFMNSGDWTLYQNKTNVRMSGLVTGDARDLVIDTDFINPRAGNTIGAFGRDGSITTYAASKLDQIASRRFWINAPKATLHEWPDGKTKGHMCTARMVHVLSFEGDWALVDIDEDGQANGYIARSVLLPFDQKPRWISGSGCKPMGL